MAASIHASMGPFDNSQEDWLSYTECFQQYFTANDIKDNADKKRAILLSVCGVETFRLIKSLLAPVKPETKSFQELVTLVGNHEHVNYKHVMHKLWWVDCLRVYGLMSFELGECQGICLPCDDRNELITILPLHGINSAGAYIRM